MELLSALFNLFLSVLSGIATLWYIWIWIVPPAIIGLLLNSPKVKGKIGEITISKTLSSLPEEKYHLINDVLLKNSDDTTQIDHIVVSAYGIFVIETKNYQGRIYGSEKSYNWTQNIYGNKKSFKNPIHQNYGHIKAIESCLSEYGSLPVISIIVFANQAELHVDTVDSPVINRRDLLTCIKTISITEKISDELVGNIIKTINENNITDKEARKKHIAEAKYKKYSVEEKANKGICPRCGSELVIRHGKNGDFIGCSKFPKCRYTNSL